MGEIKLDVQKFKHGIDKLKSFFNQRILLILGKTENMKTYGYNSATFMYLLSYEFPETALIIDSEVTFITSSKKAEILRQLGVKIVVRQKEDYSVELLRANGVSGSFGLFDIKSSKGRFCEYILESITPIDLSLMLLRFYTSKSSVELMSVVKGRELGVRVLNKGVGIVKSAVKKDEYLQCRSVSSNIENYMDSVCDDTNVDVVYSPVVQSAKFDLSKFECDNGPVDRNVLIRIGIRCNGYSTEIGRTVLLGSDDDLYNEYANTFVSRSQIVKKITEFMQSGNIEKENLESFIKEINNNYANCDSSKSFYSTGIIQNEGILLASSDYYSFCIDLRNKYENVLLNLCDNIIIRKGNIDFIASDCVDDYVFEGKSVLKKDPRFNQKEVEKNLQRNEHQKELMDALIEERIEYYKKKSYGDEKEISEEKRKFVPYKAETNLPRHEYLHIDQKNYCVLIPLLNYVLPISVETIKNVSFTDDGVLRVNLNFSGSFDMIKSISYKTTLDFARDVAHKIIELKKDFNNLNEGLVNISGKENGLQLIVGRKNVLSEVYFKIDAKMRKTKPSSLEIHENGFRYVCDAATVEILFENVKHFFFQKGTTDTRAIIHFHLHEPILAPKKTYNVQFYKECASSVHDTSKNRDEYHESVIEKEEEKKRLTINTEFELFVEKIENLTSLRAEIPLKNGSFTGVPHKGTVLIQPTNSCLVNLIESPPFVLTISEVEVASFERMVFGIKTFDLVLIFKRKDIPVCHIQSIDSYYAHRLKDFFDGKNIPFMETRINLQWNALIKEIMRNPLEFYENGAWSDLQPHREEEEEEEEESSSDPTSLESSSGDQDIGTNDSFVSGESSTISEETEEEISTNEEYSDSNDDEYESSDRNRKKRRR